MSLLGNIRLYGLTVTAIGKFAADVVGLTSQSVVLEIPVSIYTKKAVTCIHTYRGLLYIGSYN